MPNFTPTISSFQVRICSPTTSTRAGRRLSSPRPSDLAPSSCFHRSSAAFAIKSSQFSTLTRNATIKIVIVSEAKFFCSMKLAIKEEFSSSKNTSKICLSISVDFQDDFSNLRQPNRGHIRRCFRRARACLLYDALPLERRVGYSGLSSCKLAMFIVFLFKRILSSYSDFVNIHKQKNVLHFYLSFLEEQCVNFCGQ